ncbi:UvrD-helicase domain-containing protein [Qipengyuania aquimaris]|uniref:UvrD-helicase domain-containing protein n=1 Tax=Qipengyuania aquimaris TaxID=255984 RepID=UPI001C9708EB|nr:UvrD-helicase domain-containing protein [Qipengyuania aquimaris]MBY6128543.1 UvrD-helicase domain-containing protein [Qipengyuania aquimaris]
MGYRALILDSLATELLDTALIEPEWFQSLDLPPETDRLKRIIIDDLVYIISSAVEVDSNLLIIDLENVGILGNQESARYAFDRIVRVGLHHFRPEVAIPLKWAPYHDGPLLSIYAETAAKGSGNRLYFEQKTGEENHLRHLFAYRSSHAVLDVSAVPKDDSIYTRCIADYEDAVLTERQDEPQIGNYSLVLSQPLGASISGGGSLSEWYENKVTKQQRQFIDSPLTEPVRLRGAAGTGKTQSIAIKVLRELQRAENEKRKLRIAVLTHSNALAHDVIAGMLFAMDPSETWRDHSHATVWMGTLYELAKDLLQYERKGLTPLSLDGREGRQLQRMVVSEILDETIQTPKYQISTRKSLSKAFLHILDERKSDAIEEILNEFAATLDAENISPNSTEAERYTTTNREHWQFPFSEEDRKFILHLHEKYVKELESQNLLSMDQVIGDLNHYLHLHEWRQLRKTKGFDVVFVDEYHYFNRAEASSLHNIFREAKTTNGKLPIFMAYDLKQGRDDVALAHGSKAMMNFTATQAGASSLVELTEVFRSTPQIAEFLRDLDGAFPALDLEGEWTPYGGFSQSGSGEKPSLIGYETNQELVDDAFKIAREQIKSKKLSGRQVAVLCLNELLFDQYLKAGRIKDQFIPVTERSDLNGFRYAKRKCVFSMPQYVSGLQFESVILIHVDEADFDPSNNTNGQIRRQISNCYVGASRTSNTLTLLYSEERGGKSGILSGALANESLVVGEKR